MENCTLRDNPQSITSLRKAAEESGPDAVGKHLALGKMYYDGQGMPQDYAEAYFWLEVGALEPEQIKTYLTSKAELQHFDLWFSANQDLFSRYDRYRDDSASHLTAEQSSQQMARVQKWFEDHPPKVP
jgi:hypothetical protein